MRASKFQLANRANPLSGRSRRNRITNSPFQAEREAVYPEQRIVHWHGGTGGANEIAVVGLSWIDGQIDLVANARDIVEREDRISDAHRKISRNRSPHANR